MASKAFLRKQKDSQGNDVIIFLMLSHELSDIGDETVVVYDVSRSPDGSVINMVEVARDESGQSPYGEAWVGMRVDQILTSL